MGYLLKEALKTLCGVDQWSYAVYWKIGFQNPKLLIWEDCYYEPVSYSSQPSAVHFLVNKMMVDNHVNIVGQGLIGRVAFAGNHHWVLPNNCFKETCPPEVLKEVFQQFSAGMQTVAVIPVLPFGVVQFGSCKTILENVGFVQDVKSLVSQLENLPGALVPENYAAKDLDSKSGVLESFANSTPVDFSLEPDVINDSSRFDNLNYFGNSAQTSMFESQTSYSGANEMQKNELRYNMAAFHGSSSSRSLLKPQNHHQDAKMSSAAKSNSTPQNPLMNGAAKAEVIPSNAEMWMNQQASQYNPSSVQDLSSASTSLNHGMMNCTESKISTHGGQSHFSNTNLTTGTLKSPLTNYSSNCGSNDGFITRSSFDVSGLCRGVSNIMEPVIVENITSMNQDKLKNVNSGEGDKKQKFGGQIYSPNIIQPQSGDDLFDILGAEYKSSLFSSCWNGSLSNESASNARNWGNSSNFPSKASEIYSTTNGNSESAIFDMPAGTDHLLDAVVSTVHPSAKPSLDDNVSCSTTLTHISSSSTAITSLPYGRFGVSDQLKAELLGLSKYQEKARAMSSCSKEASVTYSQASSIYGLQVSSWIGKGQNIKQSNSVSTGHSKKPVEVVKTNRKRLKPGESPRPRPKDRQMIQDRVKELREIVPNGAKCSIDALLERTIKHMLFLQSVTKHADKLKQTDDSKIISKDGGLLLKDNYEGGATWAYEVGSQSMVCPIIVEDLNQPRQMLVEMLCEERGLFLEIADIIRGMGLTILKGVMETRNDKIWARFSVEANRDVTRMEIFLSLVRLLEETAKACASQPNGLSCENTMLQQFHQAAPVPMTSSQ